MELPVTYSDRDAYAEGYETFLELGAGETFTCGMYLSVSKPQWKNYGVTADYPPNTRSGHVSMEQSNQTIVVCGSQKIGRNGKSITCPIDEIDILVTDDSVSEEYCEELCKAGVKVIVAPTDK